MTTRNDLEKFKYVVAYENADKIVFWLNNRGGIAIWKSIDLSDPGKTWTTPAKQENGDPYQKPTWKVGNDPEIITDVSQVGVSVDREVKRFRIGVRRGFQGFTLKVTDAGSRRIRREVEKAGAGAYYQFSHDTQEAVIFKSEKVVALSDYVNGAGVS
jgi:ribosomal protein S6